MQTECTAENLKERVNLVDLEVDGCGGLCYVWCLNIVYMPVSGLGDL
jgi:hypothetical protein